MSLTEILTFLAALFGITLLVYLLVRWHLGKRAKRLGYSSVGAYLQAIPSSDDEKTDAADLALKGAVVCLFGINFFPLLVIGLVPLYYGGKKILLALMGMGLFSYQDNS